MDTKRGGNEPWAIGPELGKDCVSVPVRSPLDSPTTHDPHPLTDAVWRAVLYADMFGYPLTREEIVRYLPASAGKNGDLHGAIERLLAEHTLGSDGMFIYRRGRDELCELRRQRELHAQSSWPRARRYGRMVWALPFVRMVAVTGALAVDNVVAGDDIDLMIVTEPGRLWTARGMVVVVCRIARLFGDTVCPNYLVSTRALRMAPHDLYTAHELVQMVPLHGRKTATRLWLENAWCVDLLPNASWALPDEVGDEPPAGIAWLKHLAERLLRFPPGEALERWEQRRKIARLRREAGPNAAETRYTPDVCKGHDSGHAARTMALWSERLVQTHLPNSAAEELPA